MNLVDALASVKAPAKGPSCTVGLLLAGLDDTKRDAIEAAMGDPNVMHSALEAACRAADDVTHTPSSDTFSRHRRGLCRCADRG